MTEREMVVKLLERVCLGNAEAMDFLANHWSPYVHGIDDLVDGEMNSPESRVQSPKSGLDPEAVLKLFARAAMLFSHPFYLKHLAALRMVVLVVTNAYADSVAWERDPELWKRQWADHNRHAGMEMVIAVATIVGGYDHARAISQEQRCLCWQGHHDKEGKAV